MKKKYRLVKNDAGYACAIALGKQWVLHLHTGTEFNEKNAGGIVNLLNQQKKFTAPAQANRRAAPRGSAFDILARLREQAAEIAREGHAGWGNTMILAANEIEQSNRLKAELIASTKYGASECAKAVAYHQQRDDAEAAAHDATKADFEKEKLENALCWKSAMKAIYIESMGDNTAAIYALHGTQWSLHAIINPNYQPAHEWPRIATADEMVRWRTNCTTLPICISKEKAAHNDTKWELSEAVRAQQTAEAIQHAEKKILLDEIASHAATKRERDTAVAFLQRYRTETPLGNQPHMIAGDVDDFLSSLSNSNKEVSIER